MGWENVPIGYIESKCKVGEIIPLDATHIERVYEQRKAGYVSSPHIITVHVGYTFLVPVYKKKNISRK